MHHTGCGLTIGQKFDDVVLAELGCHDTADARVDPQRSRLAGIHLPRERLIQRADRVHVLEPREPCGERVTGLAGASGTAAAAAASGADSAAPASE